LLRARPSARLLLARNSLGDAPTRSAFAARCAAAGLPLSQVELRGDDGRVRDLSIFNEIDLVLDTWPFAGDATSMDALWMGVPVLTLYGRRITSRRSAALLLPLGREDLVVHSPAAYVARALELTADVRALRATRSTLRTAVRAGPWCDAAQVARSLAETFQLLWLDRLK
jgi:predicted O-linked N-acetylglucosamine transferase (SPINDLY family)